MTLRELHSATGEWFSEGWCKLWTECGNWLDFTIGQALFTIFIVIIVVILLRISSHFMY